MSLFQKSVLKNYISRFDKIKLEKSFEKFKNVFNSEKIKQIKKLKEEEYQDGFLRDLFVKILHYKIKPEKDFNIVLEKKNETNAGKTDAAIIKNNQVIAVIELKSTSLKDFSKVVRQAFYYRNNQENCKYIIISNFAKLRFYIDYANNFEEFDLFNLQKKDFDLLYFLLNKENLLNDIPLKLKNETLIYEEEISEKLYNDYFNLKNKIFQNLIKNNENHEKIILFKKSQKLLDRLLFIFFSQDIGILPTNFIEKIIKRFFILKEADNYKSMYEVYKQFFDYINHGKKGETEIDDIPAYNGGLFLKDEILDNLKIDDAILLEDVKKISKYDFKSEVDVNILGHIFEHSLKDFENLNIEKLNIRKKDGVFYTPKYITSYIIENTIGKILYEKKNNLGISDIEFDNYLNKNGKLNKEGKIIFEKLQNYKNFLFSLKILDPSCGSGAFLNSALQFLISEHKEIDNIISELKKEKLRIYDTDKEILEKNLFGVDINLEGTEIAKLSLWLRTAKKNRKLSNLNENIKCGNSLISEEFKWEKEFSEIMKNGGFDVIIGNPPYVQIQKFSGTNYQKNLENQKYKTFAKSGDLYCLFYEKGNILLKNNGIMGFITSNKWMRASYGKKLRKYFIENTNILQLIDFAGTQIFSEAKWTPIF